MLWYPSSRRVTRRIPGVAHFDGNGWAAADEFAWVGSCNNDLPTCTQLHLVDLRTGAQRDFNAPTGFAGFGIDGALLSDGTKLAVFVDREVAAKNLGSRELAVVDLETGGIEVVPSSLRVPSHVAWSPDGRTLFFGTDNATGIAAWRLGATGITQVATGLPTFSAMIAVPLPS